MNARDLAMTAALMVGAGLVALLFLAPLASGAERLGSYTITLLYAGKDYDSVSRTFRTIGEPYDSKTECDIAITRVKVMVSGGRLRCDPVETFRVF